MLRVILDTNVYGHLLREEDTKELQKHLMKSEDLIIYGYKPIRSEIRAIRKVTKMSKRTRNSLLTLYDNLTKGRYLDNSQEIMALAKRYHDHYKGRGGTYAWHTSIKVDFMIVACASLHGLDIIYSGDNKTLRGRTTREAYKHVNHEEDLRTPTLQGYEDLLQKIRKRFRACRQT